MGDTQAKTDQETTDDLLDAADKVLGGEPVREALGEPPSDQLAEEVENQDTGDQTDDEEAQADEETSESDETPETVDGESEDEDEDEDAEEGNEDGEKAEDKADEEDKDAEDDLLTPPEGLSEKARMRYEQLVSRIKEKDEAIEQRDQVIQGFRQILDETGLNNEELARVLEIGSMIKHQPEQALETLESIVRDLARQVGRPATGLQPTDILADFPDLQQAVENLEITEEAALELARARKERQRWQEQQQRLTEAQQQQQQSVQAIEAGKQQVAEVLARLEQDIDFPAMAEELADAARYAGEHLAPEQWAGYIESEFRRLKRLAGKQSASARSKETPLAGGRPRGQAKKEPTTLEELADQLL
ncbi:MAG TPA: hypothetical protein ENK10_05460 [Acidobacteria bacterium]|nr:hypothetical protein [Acidobacteriota bacterium]